MTEPKQLRDYQLACVEAHFRWFERNADEDPLFVVPTRGGKSLILAEFLRRAVTTWPETRAVVLTHVRELVAQNYAEFVDHWGGGGGLFAPAGIYSAGLSRREAQDQIVFASIQSVWTRAAELGPRDLVLVDEAHLIPKRGVGRYRSYLEDLRRISPDARAIGYTATPYRRDGGYLDHGEGRLFGGVAYEVSMDQLVRDGYLVPLVAKRGTAQIDLSQVRVEDGEFKLGEMEDAARAAGCVEAAVAEVVEWARVDRRRSWLVYCCGVDHARDVLEALRRRGVSADLVLGDTPTAERDRAVADFKAGRTTALVNVLVLTTGFNAPRCDLLVMLRGTHSAALYVQVFGRGMTPYVDEHGVAKEDCLVLDFGGNVERHGPINRVRPRHQRADGSDKGPPPTKVCPRCATFVPLGTRQCPDCLWSWPEAVLRDEHARVASWDAPFDPEAVRSHVAAVSSWHLRAHEKEGRPTSLRVDYACGMRVFSEWVCLEHDGYARLRAARWWLSHGGTFPPPRTVDDALRRVDELRCPDAVEVVQEGRYDRVVRAVAVSEKIRLDGPPGAA